MYKENWHIGTDGNWHHYVTVISDDNKKMLHYVDGAFIKETDNFFTERQVLIDKLVGDLALHGAGFVPIELTAEEVIYIYNKGVELTQTLWAK